MSINYTTRVLVLFFSLLLSAQLVQAVAITDTSASLTLDWSSLESQVVWGDGNYRNNGADASINTDTGSSGYVSVYDSGWYDDPSKNIDFISEAKDTNDALGKAHTDYESANVITHAKADGLGIITLDGYENVNASGTSHRGKTFTPNQDGNLTFSFEYLISHAFSNEGPLDVNSAYTQISLVLRWTDDQNIEQEVVDRIIKNNEEGIFEGTLGFTENLLTSYTYYLEGHVYSSASANSPHREPEPMPLPTSLALLGLGLLGIRLTQRKA